MNLYSRTYAAIDLDAVLHNIDEIKRIIDKDTKILAIIKTDGYGHGAVPIGKELENIDYIWGYGVATVEEGVILRRNGLTKPILMLGASFPEQFEIMARDQIRPTIYSYSMAKELSDAMEELELDLKFHIKIDTGLSRLGFQISESSVDEIAQINALPHMLLEGIFTHFVMSDSNDKTYSCEQMKKFDEMIKLLQERGVKPEILHFSNSAGIIDIPKANLNLVRAGIILYGLWPSDEVDRSKIDLKPALSLKSRIIFLKELEAGRTISYGATYGLDHTSLIATIPIGYGDGYPRSLSNKGYVLIRGQRAPICGRICMDQFMVDVTHIAGVKEGDEVTLIGTDGNESITVEELGDLSGRFNYEFVCNLGKRIPRIYKKDGVVVDKKDYFNE